MRRLLLSIDDFIYQYCFLRSRVEPWERDPQRARGIPCVAHRDVKRIKLVSSMPPKLPQSASSPVTPQRPSPKKRPHFDDDDNLSPAKRTRSSGIPPLEILIDGAPGAKPSPSRSKRRRMNKSENESPKREGDEWVMMCSLLSI